MLAFPRRLTDVEAWQPHIPLAFFLVQLLRPDVFVEPQRREARQAAVAPEIAGEQKILQKAGDQHAPCRGVAGCRKKRRHRQRRGGGDELLAYKRGRRWVDVKSSDINAWLKDATGEDVSAKDFRTWGATVLAAVGLAVSPVPPAKTARKRAMARVVKEVAHHLGNTPAVARASYIDPRVFDRYLDGTTIAGTLPGLAEEGDGTAIQGEVEPDMGDLDLPREREQFIFAIEQTQLAPIARGEFPHGKLRFARRAHVRRPTPPSRWKNDRAIGIIFPSTPAAGALCHRASLRRPCT